MRWSLTKIKIFEKCKAQYKYRYKDFLKGAKSAAAARGTDSHALIEGFLKKELDALPADLSFYEGFLRGLRDAQSFPELKIALKEDLSCCDWDDPEVWLQTVIDLTVLTPPIATNYDWKTGKIYDDHDEQKELYALSVFARWTDLSEVQSYHVYTDLGQTRRKAYLRSQVPDMWERWKARVREMERYESNKFALIPEPGFHCNWCPYSKLKGGPCPF